VSRSHEFKGSLSTEGFQRLPDEPVERARFIAAQFQYVLQDLEDVAQVDLARR
jgi:hypothetical protein